MIPQKIQMSHVGDKVAYKCGNGMNEEAVCAVFIKVHFKQTKMDFHVFQCLISNMQAIALCLCLKSLCLMYLHQMGAVGMFSDF